MNAAYHMSSDAGAQTDDAAADSSLKAMKAEVAAKQRRLKSLHSRLTQTRNTINLFIILSSRRSLHDQTHSSV